MTTLKLMSWNIQEGGDGRRDAIAALVRAQKPHCVALLEADSLTIAEAHTSELRWCTDCSTFTSAAPEWPGLCRPTAGPAK